jgi:glycosyltransferase involved in cell wall biosynthesis
MKISVITPSFNQGQFIGDTINSVLSQDIPEIEYVVMDGGSTDDTIQVLKSFGSRVRWVSEKDNGQADAVNKGLNATNGEIIGWINSDDIYYPGALNEVINFFHLNPDIDVLYGKADHINILGIPFEEYPSEEWNFERLLRHCFICQPALFFRRKVVQQCGPLDQKLNYCMDYEYWIRLALSGLKFQYIGKKLAGSRLYNENKTLGARVAVHREINDMLFDKLGFVPDRWLFNYSHILAAEKIDRAINPGRFIFMLACNQ